MGDVKLLAVIGLYLGLYALLALFFATLLGAVYGVATARARQRWSLRDARCPSDRSSRSARSRRR